MTPPVRRFVLAAHIVISVGWIGALASYLVLDVMILMSDDIAELRMSYAAMDLIVSRAIVPLALASLVTGLVISLGTPWGLFRHWWVVISLALTLLAVVVLLMEAPTVHSMAEIAAGPATAHDTVRHLGSTIVHSVGGLVVLVTVTFLNVYKPRGLTPYGWRREQAELAARTRTDAPS